MKCFNHQDRDSVGICRICGKALCSECAVTSSFGLTCKGDCEKTALGYADRMASATRAQGMVKKLSGYYALIVGILILALSFFIGGTGLIRYFILVPAIALILWGIFLIKKNKKVKS